MVLYHTAITVVLVGGVAAVSFFLTVLAFRSRARTGNRRLSYIATAFALFCVKSLVTALGLLESPSATSTDPFPLGHGHLEFLGSAFDLVIIVLMAAPFIRRPRRNATAPAAAGLASGDATQPSGPATDSPKRPT